MGLRVMVVGGGAREHALLWGLSRSARVEKLWCAPGNGGTAEIAESVAVRATDVDGVVAAAGRLAVELVVVGPEEPLAAGLIDRLGAMGIRACGPGREAARIETSKVWAKEVMAEAGVPTARWVAVSELMAGLTALSSFAMPVVIKADGLAAGKGVVVAANRDEARAALTAFLEDRVLGAAGGTVVIEECLVGEEVSVLALTDGVRVATLPPARDAKRAFDRDRGPNTGGMGAYTPSPALDAGALAEVERTVLVPTVRALAARGTPFRGVLYAGLMLTERGPRVLEFNARFGDPEAQAILPIVDGDLAELLLATAGDGELPPTGSIETKGAAVAVTVVAGGYPGPFESGLPIAGLDRVPEDVLVFHGGTRREGDGRVVTAGGRVLTVVGRGPDLAGARERAYAGVAAVSFWGMRVRSDIGGGVGQE